MKKLSKGTVSQTAALRIIRTHYLYIAAYAASLAAFDSWNLVAHEAMVKRWILASGFLVLVSFIWYMVKMKHSHHLRLLIGIVLTSDIIFAALNVYWQRGMASKSVALFFIPIISAAVLKSRALILATTSVCVAAYSLAAVSYFHNFYGEGYKVELYGEVGFYSAIFFIAAWLLIAIIGKDVRE